MTRTTINGQKYMKRKDGQPLTTEEKKKIEKGEMVWSHYATEYTFYKIIK